MAWEESWLFPLIDARDSTSWTTRFVRFDHQQIAPKPSVCARSPPVEPFRSRDTVTLIADLSGLETLLRANVEREERLLLPLLEAEAERWEPEWRD